MSTLIETAKRYVLSIFGSQEDTSDARFFDPKNANLKCQQKVLSPSGKYELTTTPYTTKAGCWNYMQGLVRRVATGEIVGDVRRNYASFPYEWVENHANGHDYLVCGEDYQGQTVIELDTGKRVDHLPSEAKEGVGFCWVDMTYDPATKILVVDGCIWACPFEFRFYDFSDPLAGWSEITADTSIDADSRHPEISADGTIKCFQSAPEDDDSDDGGNPEIAAITTFKREGLKLVLVNEWVSEAEQNRRADRTESERKYNEWKANFKATDPLYLAYQEAVKNPVLFPEEYESIGFTHEGWCHDFTGEERLWCRRIVKNRNHYTIDLEWAVLTGPIKLVLYKRGQDIGSKFFDHSVEGMQQAFTHALELIHG